MDSEVQQCAATEAFKNGKNVSLSFYEVPSSFVLVISCTTKNLLLGDPQRSHIEILKHSWLN